MFPGLIVNALLLSVNDYGLRVKSVTVIVNERIRAIRLHKGMGTHELARKAGLSPAAISRLETSARMPRLDTIQKIAAAYDVSISFLAGDEDTDVDLALALAHQSLRIYLRRANLPAEDRSVLERIASEISAPQACEDWEKLQHNLNVARALTRI